jgi:hypothetical protein
MPMEWGEAEAAGEGRGSGSGISAGCLGEPPPPGGAPGLAGQQGREAEESRDMGPQRQEKQQQQRLVASLGVFGQSAALESTASITTHDPKSTGSGEQRLQGRSSSPDPGLSPSLGPVLPAGQPGSGAMVQEQYGMAPRHGDQENASLQAGAGAYHCAAGQAVGAAASGEGALTGGAAGCEGGASSGGGTGRASDGGLNGSACSLLPRSPPLAGRHDPTHQSVLALYELIGACLGSAIASARAETEAGPAAARDKVDSACGSDADQATQPCGSALEGSRGGSGSGVGTAEGPLVKPGRFSFFSGKLLGGGKGRAADSGSGPGPGSGTAAAGSGGGTSSAATAYVRVVRKPLVRW